VLSKLALDLARPFLRYSPRFTGFVYKQLGGERDDADWGRYGKRVTRGREHGYRMLLDLGHWSQRAAYYQGRFYDLAAQRVIMRLLRPGDAFVDVGANIGMLTLSAAAAVGPKGTILAFEPHPHARADLCGHLDLNGLTHVRVFDCALSAERGGSTLFMPTDSPGQSTLRPVGDQVVRSFEVDVRTLDDFGVEIPKEGRTLVKIDVEGFELNVLRGARELLSRLNVAVLVETTDAWLREQDQSAAELFAFMADTGYRPYHPRMQPRLLQQRLVIEPVSLPGPHHQFDALFLRGSMETWLGVHR